MELSGLQHAGQEAPTENHQYPACTQVISEASLIPNKPKTAVHHHSLVANRMGSREVVEAAGGGA